jgi:two-component system sensor histidine kinase/response regulator
MNTNAAAHGSKILVVDDQDINQRMVSGIVGRLGFDVYVATDGERALSLLAQQAFDLILLDVLMPGQDGFAVCAAIRAHPEWVDIPIIFLSAADDKDLIVRALDAGGVDYITKPFNAAELVSRVRTHIALKVARDQLKRLAEDKDELLGILAHDLKNHLGGIKLSAHVLHGRMQKQNNAELTRLAANIHSGTDQMFAFVVEFLANCAADRGFALRTEPLWLDEIAASATARYAETAARKGIKLSCSGKVTDPTLADATAINQILHNLISNAVKFSPAGTAVHVRVDSDGAGAAVCQIQDEGPGFSAADRSKMFQRYQRLSAQPTADEPSTGLGLSIVKKLVHHLGAELDCTSGAAGGTTFTLRFPAFVFVPVDDSLTGNRAVSKSPDDENEGLLVQSAGAYSSNNPKAITRAAE